ncbi:MAG: acyl carrier protein [Alphaproteobacteria bacterium]
MNADKNNNLAKILLAKATERTPDEVPSDAAVDTWDGWDSLSHMRLILAMESHLGRELPPEAVVEIACVDDIARYL